MPVVGLTPSRAVIVEDVRDLWSWSSHDRRRYGAAAAYCLVSPPAARRAQAFQRALDLAINTVVRCSAWVWVEVPRKI